MNVQNINREKRKKNNFRSVYSPSWEEKQCLFVLEDFHPYTLFSQLYRPQIRIFPNERFNQTPVENPWTDHLSKDVTVFWKGSTIVTERHRSIRLVYRIYVWRRGRPWDLEAMYDPTSTDTPIEGLFLEPTIQRLFDRIYLCSVCTTT